MAVAEWVDAMNKVRGVETPSTEIETWLVDNRANPKPSVPPKPEKASTRRWRLALAIALVAVFLWALAIFLRNEVDDITLAHYGVVLQAQVVGHDHEDDGDGESSDYLWIAIPACHCNVRVPTNNPSGHPKGTTIPARYDPSDPSNAQSLVDVPLQWPSDLAGGGSS